MLNEPWQDDRVFTTPVGELAGSFLRHRNTVFHQDGEWSVRLVLPTQRAHLLRRVIDPAYEDILARGRARHAALPFEQQIGRPFRENPYWQAVRAESGIEREGISFIFRAPAVDHETQIHIPVIDRRGEEIKSVATEPDGQDGIISFSIHQFWLRSFGAGVSLRLKKVQLLGARAHRPLHHENFEASGADL